jgi:hypothetical protein
MHNNRWNNPYRSPRGDHYLATRDAVSGPPHPYIVCLLLIALNVAHHAALLMVAHLSDRFIEFDPWYRVVACYIPPLFTVAVAGVLIGFQQLSMRGGVVVIIISGGMAFLHGVLIDAAAASV